VDAADTSAEAQWEVEQAGRPAVLLLPLVRQDGRPRPVGPPLLLVPDDDSALVAPVELAWHLSGAEPSVNASGRLVVTPADAGGS